MKADVAMQRQLLKVGHYSPVVVKSVQAPWGLYYLLFYQSARKSESSDSKRSAALPYSSRLRR